MNVFYVNDCPVQAAREHCVVHIRKMIVEYAQLLSTAHHLINPESDLTKVIYRKTHFNHPSAVWVRESRAHYQWVYTCATELCRLYSFRTGKSHATTKVLDKLVNPPKSLEAFEFTPPPVAAPQEFKIVGERFGTTTAYQHYMTHKLNTWLESGDPRKKVEFIHQIPNWFTTEVCVL